jgi:acyl carrier protein
MTEMPEFCAGLIAWIRRHGNGKSRVDVQIGAETDLLATGMLDSQGLVELLMFIEDEYGYELDLSEAEPADYSTVKGLFDLVSRGGR